MCVSIKVVVVFTRDFLSLTRLRRSLAVAYFVFILSEGLTANTQQLCLSLPSFREAFSEAHGFGSVPLRLHILTCIQSPHARFQKVTEFFLNNYLTSFNHSRVVDPLPVPLPCVLAKFKPVRSAKACSAAVIGERVLNHEQISFS